MDTKPRNRTITATRTVQLRTPENAVAYSGIADVDEVMGVASFDRPSLTRFFNTFYRVDARAIGWYLDAMLAAAEYRLPDAADQLHDADAFDQLHNDLRIFVDGVAFVGTGA